LRARGRLPRPTLRAALAAALGLAGLGLIGQSLYMDAKAALAQVLLERAFSESLATGAPVKAWRWADTWPVARLEVPRLGASEIALAGTSGEALAFGPGRLAGAPEAGEPGTAVYAAHRDTHFAFLRHVRVGDEIRVTRRDGVTARFRVERLRVAPWNASGIDPQAQGRRLALVTCWPFDALTPGPLRYVVEAQAIDDVAQSGDAGR
ncbi:class GN sortase, partial [Methylopila musalis]